VAIRKVDGFDLMLRFNKDHDKFNVNSCGVPFTYFIVCRIEIFTGNKLQVASCGV